MNVLTQKSDRPGYPDFSGRAPWALVTGAEPLNFQPPVRIAGPAEASVGSATSGRDIVNVAYPSQESKRNFGCLDFWGIDRPGYPDFSGRAPWALVTGAEPLNPSPQICQAGSAETFEGSFATGSDRKVAATPTLSSRKAHHPVPVSVSKPFLHLILSESFTHSRLLSLWECGGKTPLSQGATCRPRTKAGTCPRTPRLPHSKN